MAPARRGYEPVIPLTRPAVAFDEVADDLHRIFSSGILTSGEYVEGFECDLAEYVGTSHAVATTSATSALHLVLAGAGIGPGDEVLVSDFTFPASGNVIAACGATPVLVDCRADAFVLDLDDAAAKLTPRTKALMAVDPFGEPPDLTAASALAADNGLLLLEDAACALGAESDGRRCGAWPGAGCFSFHPRKIITTGEGGMVTTSDDGLADRLRLLRSHGGVRDGLGMRFEHHGFNYRMSEVQAAIGRVQMRHVDEFLAGRRTAAAGYLDALQDVPEIRVPSAVSDGATFQSFVVLLSDAIDRDLIAQSLRAEEVETTLGTYAMHAHAAFAGYGYHPGDLPNSLRAQQQSLTLPLWPGMAPEIIERVAELLGDAIKQQG